MSASTNRNLTRSLVITMVAVIAFCGLLVMGWMLLLTEDPMEEELGVESKEQTGALPSDAPDSPDDSGKATPIDRHRFTKEAADQAYSKEHHAQLVDFRGAPRPQVALWVVRENGVGHRMTTDAEGIIRATRTTTPDGRPLTWKVAASSAGFDPESLPTAGAELELAPSPTTASVKTFQLPNEQVLCAGRVLDTEGLPVACSVTITAIRAGHPTKRSRWPTNAKGEFFVPGVNRNRWSYSVGAFAKVDAYPYASVLRTFRPGSKALELVIYRYRSVQGTYDWKHGIDLGGLHMALVSTNPASGPPGVGTEKLTLNSVSWLGTKKFTFRLVPPGTYDFHIRISAPRKGGLSTIHSIPGLNVPPGSGAFAPPELQSVVVGQNLVIKEALVLNSGGRPAQAAKVTLFGNESARVTQDNKRWTAFADAKGKVKIVEPNATDLELVVEFAGHQAERIPVPPWPKTIQLHNQGAVVISFTAPLPTLSSPHTGWKLMLVTGGGFSARPKKDSPSCRLAFGATQASFDSLKPVLYRAFLIPTQEKDDSLEARRLRARFVGIVNLKRQANAGALTLEILPENLSNW